MKKEDIALAMENGLLTVSGTSKEEKKNSYLRREYKFSAFIRSFSLPDNANDGSITSRYEDGFRKITIHKKETVTKKEKKPIAIS